MKFELKPTLYFLKQLEKLDLESISLIERKLKLLKENPFRNKALVGYKNTFEIKISIEKNYSRIIYTVYLPKSNQITIFGIFKRKNDFKE